MPGCGSVSGALVRTDVRTEEAGMLPHQGSVSRRPGTVSWLGAHYSGNEAFLLPGNPSAVARWAMADKHGRTILRDSPPGPATTILGHRLLPARTKPHRRLARGWARYSRPTPLVAVRRSPPTLEDLGGTARAEEVILKPYRRRMRIRFWRARLTRFPRTSQWR
jgi:hypothetical protein